AYARLYLWNSPAAGTVYLDDIRVAGTYAGPTGAAAVATPTPTRTPVPPTATPTPVPPTATPTATSPAAGTYPADGLESGGRASWAKVGTGAASAQTAVVNSGAYAAALANTNSGDYVTLYADLAGGAQAQTYTRFCFRLSGVAASTVLAQGRDAAGNNL